MNLPDFFNSASPTPQGFNEFIGSGGDDTITGNGNTRADYEFANGAVTVNLANGSGTADGDGSTGHDTFTGGVQAVIGSSFGDTIVGGGGGADQFEYGSAAEGLDTISDFTSETDRFRIREAGFGIARASAERCMYVSQLDVGLRRRCQLHPRLLSGARADLFELLRPDEQRRGPCA